LTTVCERVFRDYKFELPSTNIKSFVATEQMIEDPVGELQKLLSNPRDNKRLIAIGQVRDYEHDYEQKYNIKLNFSDEAIRLISDKALGEGKTIRAVCDEILGDYEYGLNLIKRNTGKSDFDVTADVVTDPSGTLDKWVKQFYTSNTKEIGL